MNRSDLIQQRLSALRDAMKRHKLDVYFVPTADPHNSEYIAEHWKSREWFSGFRGSAGTLVVSADKAALWTDSRYFLQAEEELSGTGIELMKDGLAETPDIVEWIRTHCSISSANFTVGLDLRHLRHWTVLRRFFKLRDERCGSRRRSLEGPPGAAETPHCSPPGRMDK